MRLLIPLLFLLTTFLTLVSAKDQLCLPGSSQCPVFEPRSRAAPTKDEDEPPFNDGPGVMPNNAATNKPIKRSTFFVSARVNIHPHRRRSYDNDGPDVMPYNGQECHVDCARVHAMCMNQGTMNAQTCREVRCGVLGDKVRLS
jgi:hypothetical protein